MSHISGKKIAKSHSSVIGVAMPLLKAVNKLSEVDKIVTGEIKVIKRGPRRIKIEIVPVGLKIMVRDINVRQVLYIYTSEVRGVVKLIISWVEGKWIVDNRSMCR